MKLIEVIKYLINPSQLNVFYQEYELNTESEALLIYQKEKLDLESDIAILEIEETEDNVLFEKDGIQYIQLFPIDYAIELIESNLELKGKGNSDLQIAKRLLDYRERDA